MLVVAKAGQLAAGKGSEMAVQMDAVEVASKVDWKGFVEAGSKDTEMAVSWVDCWVVRKVFSQAIVKVAWTEFALAVD